MKLVNLNALLEVFFSICNVFLFELSETHIIFQLSVLGVELFSLSVESHGLLEILLLEIGDPQIKETLEAALSRPLQVFGTCVGKSVEILQLHELETFLFEICFLLFAGTNYERLVGVAEEIALLFPFLASKDVLLLSVE